MLCVRTVKTASFSTAVQVVRYEGKRTVVVKHIGSGKTTGEILLLKKEASDWIHNSMCLQSLFKEDFEKSESKIIQLNKCKFLGVRYSFAYETLNSVFKIIGFSKFEKVLLDLVLIRIFSPASKLHSISLLTQYFGINYTESEIYRGMVKFLLLKNEVEKAFVEFAKQNLNFDFHLVLYDITTLYFESFKSDALRKCGFSKDNKFNQPQILIGLIINRDGFPISYEVFEGNKFEGHTLLPSILAYKNRYQISDLTVVADAAMISKKNVESLLLNDLNYIVGARLGSLKYKLIEQISRKLNRANGRSIKMETKRGILICDFSSKRYRKDFSDWEKQVQKAKNILEDSSLLKKNKYLKNRNKTSFELNQKLINKTKLLLGIKGYYTNLKKPKTFIIQRYHDLWKIEKSFRIAKSDLEMRPIYHFKSEAIKSHILICFMALGVLKYMEIKTKKPPQRIIELLMSISNGRIFDKVSNEEIIMKMEITDEVKNLLNLICLPH